MPKFPGFGRRKSTANALEDLQNAGAANTSGESSFRVFERPGANKSFDGGVKLNRNSRSSISPTPKDDNIFEELKGNRGSATSNTNTVSTTDNSSRLSGASTTPSSTDLHHQVQENYASPHDKPFSDIPIPPIPTKSASAFSLKKDGRTWSFGRGKSTPSLSKGLEDHSSLDHFSHDFSRSRSGTTESHANMAAMPLKLENNDSSFGGEFSSMFSGFGKRKSAVLVEDENEHKTISQSSDGVSPQIAKPLPSYTANRSNNPSPLHFDRSNQVEPAPNSWGSHESNEGLMGNISPRYPPLPINNEAAKRASYIGTGSDPSVPTRASYGNMGPVDSGRDSYLGGSQSTVRPQRQERPVNDSLKRSSAHSTKRRSNVEKQEFVDEDAKLLRQSVKASRRMNETEKTRVAHFEDDSGASSMRGASSVQTTPRAHKVEPVSPDLASPTSEDNLFDQSLASEANVAMSYNDKPLSPPPAQKSLNKVMTPAQFEQYKQDQERDLLRNGGAAQKEEDEDEEEEDNYEDDEDEAEKQRQVTKQRRKQEAHMAVYRQQMMKVTGEQPSPLPTRPGMMASMSTPNLPSIPIGKSASDEGEEDEEVPLAILAAHGFPNKNRPPSQLSQMSSNPNIRASMAAQMENSGGHSNLPVFARNLPQDPYFGAGLVNPINRESLAFGQAGPGSAHGGSVYGGSSRGAGTPPAGGLVGVIAGEERARAARRGSPNPHAGGFGGFDGTTPPPGFPTQLPMPPMHGMQPMMSPMGQPMVPQLLTPGDQAQIQMTQQMTQFMQMQMQFMQMMAGGQVPQQNGGLQPSQPAFGRSSTMGNVAPPDFLGQGLNAGLGARPNSSQQQRTFSMMESQPRTMSMMDIPNAPWMNPQANGSRGSLVPSINAPGYAPSIAPSERSNVGLPGRYRPVSHAPSVDVSPEKPRTSTMSNVLSAGWENKPVPTIRAVPRRDVEEEDEEEAWAEMKRKKEKKKSLWKTKKDNNGLKEMLSYAN